MDESSEEKGIIRYDTPRGAIMLTVKIVRQFFCPKATELEALAFAGYCKHTGLNPFLREVYLVKYDEAEPASMIIAYQSFMKRAERAEGYGGFRAGIVIAPRKPDLPPLDGAPDVPGIPAPFVALEGTLIPPEWELAGGWCVVTRQGRAPVVATVRLEEYLQRRRDGKPTRAWDRMPATMIRKVPIGQAHRDAWPDEVAGMVLEEEGGARIEAGENLPLPDLMPRRKDEPPEMPAPEAPPLAPGPLPSYSEAVIGGLPGSGDSAGLQTDIPVIRDPDPVVAVVPSSVGIDEPSPLAPGQLRITINGRDVITNGATKEQMLKCYKLGALLDQMTHQATAKEILGREVGCVHREELTEAGARLYIAALSKAINVADKRR